MRRTLGGASRGPAVCRRMKAFCTALLVCACCAIALEGASSTAPKREPRALVYGTLVATPEESALLRDVTATVSIELFGEDDGWYEHEAGVVMSTDREEYGILVPLIQGSSMRTNRVPDMNVWVRASVAVPVKAIRSHSTGGSQEHPNGALIAVQRTLQSCRDDDVAIATIPRVHKHVRRSLAFDVDLDLSISNWDRDSVTCVPSAEEVLEGVASIDVSIRSAPLVAYSWGAWDGGSLGTCHAYLVAGGLAALSLLAICRCLAEEEDEDAAMTADGGRRRWERNSKGRLNAV